MEVSAVEMSVTSGILSHFTTLEARCKCECHPPRLSQLASCSWIDEAFFWTFARKVNSSQNCSQPGLWIILSDHISRQTSSRSTSPKLGNSHRNNQDGSDQKTSVRFSSFHHLYEALSSNPTASHQRPKSFKISSNMLYFLKVLKRSNWQPTWRVWNETQYQLSYKLDLSGSVISWNSCPLK